MGVPSFASATPTVVAYVIVDRDTLPVWRDHVAPAAGAVAVFNAVFVSPGAVVRIPPKKTRSPPSAVRITSG